MHVHHYKGGQEKVEKGGELKKSCKNGGGEITKTNGKKFQKELDSLFLLFDIKSVFLQKNNHY